MERSNIINASSLPWILQFHYAPINIAENQFKIFIFLIRELTNIGWLSLLYYIHRYGRKRVFFLSWTVMVLAKFCCAVSNHFWLFAALEFVAGFAQGGVVLVAAVIATELVGPNYKSLVGSGLGLIDTISLCFLGIQGWLLLNWRHFLMVTTVPYLIVLLGYRYNKSYS